MEIQESCNECGEPLDEYNSTEHCEECIQELALFEADWEERADEE